MAQIYTFEARWGQEVASYGIDSIPNVFLSNYAKLGISPNQSMAIVHAFSFKWTSEHPFPSMSTIAELMGKSQRQVIRYFKDLEKRGFLIKTERFAEDGRQLSCLLDFSPLLAACIQVANRGEGDTHDTRVRVTPMTHETEEVQETETTTSTPGTKLSPTTYRRDVVVKEEEQRPVSDLIGFGINERIAIQMVAEYGIDRVIEVVAWVKNQNGLIRNPAGLARKALEEGWNIAPRMPVYYSPPPKIWRGFEELTETETERQVEVTRQGLRSLREALQSAMP